MTTPTFKKIKLEAYKPGKSFLNKKKNIIKLSANESALGMSKNASKVLKKFRGDISKYPDGKFRELTSIISKKYNCKQNQIICGSGSDELGLLSNSLDDMTNELQKRITNERR